MSSAEYDDEVLDAAARYAQAEVDTLAVVGTAQSWAAFCRKNSAYRLLRDQRDGLHSVFRVIHGDGGRCTCGLIVNRGIPDVLALRGHRNPFSLLPEVLLIGHARARGQTHGPRYRVHCQVCGWDQTPCVRCGRHTINAQHTKQSVTPPRLRSEHAPVECPLPGSVEALK